MPFTMNRLWTMFQGRYGDAADDWIRITESTPGGAGVRAIFSESDANIRGWLVETAVQAALQSSYRTNILRLDPVNSYVFPLRGETLRFDTDLVGGAVFPYVTDHRTWQYRQTASYSLDLTAETWAATLADGTSSSGTIDLAGRRLTLPFRGTGSITLGLPTGAEGSLEFTVTGRILPSEPPLSILRARLMGQFPSNGFERWPTTEMLGWLAMQVFGEANG